jgi:hypothetical protein
MLLRIRNKYKKLNSGGKSIYKKEESKWQQEEEIIGRINH